MYTLRQPQGARLHTEGTRQLLHNFDYRQLLEQRNRCTLYISSLPGDATEGELRLVFAPFGEVKNIELPRHEDSRLKGYCFLEYTEEEAAVGGWVGLLLLPLLLLLGRCGGVCASEKHCYCCCCVCRRWRERR